MVVESGIQEEITSSNSLYKELKESIGNLIICKEENIIKYKNKINELKSIKDNLFTFLDTSFESIINVENNEIWFKVKEIMDFLGYSNSNKLLYDLIKEKNIKKSIFLHFKNLIYCFYLFG